MFLSFLVKYLNSEKMRASRAAWKTPTVNSNHLIQRILCPSEHELVRLSAFK